MNLLASLAAVISTSALGIISVLASTSTNTPLLAYGFAPAPPTPVVVAGDL